MYRIIITILLVNLFISGCRIDGKNNSKNMEIHCDYISIIKNYKGGKEVDGSEFEEAIEHLESITGIQSEVNPSYLGLKNPSEKTLKNWIDALKKMGINCIS